ncbi:midasin [Dorcoceras hygrometricum]|uniref:Midasin n=1 Tax=Dorcoceras hygrometricum TaxID=472368 RepID=A0A2Z7A243_9LAMI|nr:midasin [Dorcoceras hygrometricum]
MVTSKNFDLMVAITARLKVNWAQVLFQVLVAMVNNPNRQSQGFAVHTYIKKNVDVRPAGESSRQTEDTTSGNEGGHSHMTKPVEKKKVAKAAVEKSKIRKRSSDEDSCPLARLKNRRAKRKQVVESSDSEATVSVPPMRITRKHWNKRSKKVSPIVNDQAESQPNPIFDIPVGGERASAAGGPEADTENTPALETRAGDEFIAGGEEGHVGTTPEQEERVDGTDFNAEEHEGRMDCETQTDQECQASCTTQS